MHIQSKLTKFILNNDKGIFRCMAVSFFQTRKKSVIYCKFYSPVPILTSVCMGTRFTFDSCHYSLPFIRSIKAHRLPFIANIKS